MIERYKEIAIYSAPVILNKENTFAYSIVHDLRKGFATLSFPFLKNTINPMIQENSDIIYPIDFNYDIDEDNININTLQVLDAFIQKINTYPAEERITLFNSDDSLYWINNMLDAYKFIQSEEDELNSHMVLLYKQREVYKEVYNRHWMKYANTFQS